MRKSTKIALLVAALVALCSFAAFAGWKWDEAALEWTYLDKYDEMVYGTWEKDTNGVYYYLGDEGYMLRNELIEYDGNWYYVDANGAKVTNAWIAVPVDEDDVEDNFDETYRWYRFDAKGRALKNAKKTVGDFDYIFDANGKMCFGYVTADWTMCDNQDDPFSTDCLYYCGTNADGAVKKNVWYKLENLEDKGAYEQTSAWVYFQSNGKKATDSEYGVKWNGQRYYFAADGKMLYNWSDISTANTYSAWLGGEDEGLMLKKAWVYTDKGTSDDENKWFWVDNRGEKTGYNKVLKINNKQYAFDGNAEMLSNIVELENVDAETGAILPETTKVVGKVKTSNVTLAKWLEKTGNFYFFSDDYKNDGSLKKSATFEVEFADDNYKLYTNKYGKLMNGLESKKYYKNGYLLAADAEEGKAIIEVQSGVYKLVDAYGNVTKAGKTAKDLDGNYYYVEADAKGNETIYMVPEYVEKASTVAGYLRDGKTSITIDKVEYTFKKTATEYGFVVTLTK